MSLNDASRHKIIRLNERGIPIGYIAEAMGRTVDQIEGYLKRHRETRHTRMANSIRRLVTVKDPEKYMRERGVWYGEAA